MKRNQAGFTLIELVMVIVILGVLAAVALPKFVDLKGDAGDASAKATAGALSSATSMNYAQYSAKGGPGATGVAPFEIKSGTAVCADLKQLMVGNALPTDISFVDAATPAKITCTNGVDTSTCVVKHASGATAAGFPVTAVCTN